ncbi:DMT family transporter [Alteribacillus sp. JSM 102045]|uniref:DMT family transporter n=1 Tax=Alteribacillus sp. JSM 102045 TaxID=1562101 RepID=UPI0035C0E546
MNLTKINRALIPISILFLAVSWGYSWSLMKIGLQHMGPFTFSFLRFAIGGVFLLLFLFVFKKGTWKSLYTLKWRHIIILGILQTFAVFGLITYAMLFVDAGKTSIILYTMPIWSSVLAALFLKETVTRKNVSGLLLGISGLSFIIGADLFEQATWQNTIGILLILAASLCWAAANIYFRLNLAGSNQLSVTAFQMIIGSLGLACTAFIFESGQTVQWNGESIFSLLFTGVIASSLCFSIWYYLLSVINTVTVTISTLLVPVFGVLFGHFLLAEELTLSMIVGAFFILMGIFISQAGIKRLRFSKGLKEHKAVK